MDDDFRLLEAELKRLRPVAPDPAVARRIRVALAGAPKRSLRLPRRWAVGLPAAAAAAVLIAAAWPSLSRPRLPTGPATEDAGVAAKPDDGAVFKPIAVENVLYAAQDEGIVTLADGTAARRERLQYVDTITWRNPRTNASLKWIVPREEVRVVPVSFQ